MRRILILGGTAWLGREIARQALTAGDAVTCLARGESGSVARGATLVAADRRDPGAYDDVASGEWDDVIELSYDPRFVADAAAALSGRAAHWTLVSSVSVYASNEEKGADETSAIVEPDDRADYAGAKVASERATARSVDAARLLIARPGLIAGRGDASDRLGYWVGRFALAGAGAVLSPRSPGRRVQAIDVRDLAEWILLAGRIGTTGTVNAVGASLGLGDFLARSARIAGFTGDVIERHDSWLSARGVTFWAGPRSLPLWLPSTASGFAERSGARYLAAGGALRAIDDTIAAALSDERARGLQRERRAGLARGDELDLLRAAAE